MKRPFANKRLIGPVAQVTGSEDYLIIFQFKSERFSPLGTDDFTFEPESDEELLANPPEIIIKEVRDIIESNLDSIEFVEVDGRDMVYEPVGVPLGDGLGRTVVLWEQGSSFTITGIAEDLEKSDLADIPSLDSVLISEPR